MAAMSERESQDEDPRWIDLQQVVEIAGEPESTVLVDIQVGRLPGPSWRKVKVGEDWQWAHRWWKPSVELNVMQRRARCPD